MLKSVEIVDNRSANFSLKPVGAGPCAIDGAWFPRESMSVRAWPGYWNKTAQLLGGVDFTNVLEGATVNAMQAGSIDVNVVAATDATASKGDSCRAGTAAAVPVLFTRPSGASAVTGRTAGATSRTIDRSRSRQEPLTAMSREWSFAKAAL